MNNIVWLIVFISLVILFFLILPWNIKAKIKYDMLKNNGKIELKLFKLLVFKFNFKIERGYLELNSIKTNKTILVPIIFNQTGSSEAVKQFDFITILLKKIYVQQGTTYINFGAKSDCYATAMIIGFIKAIFSCLAAYLKTKKHESRVKNKIYPSFKKDMLVFCFKGSIRISILQVLLAKLKADIMSIKYKKEIAQYE